MTEKRQDRTKVEQQQSQAIELEDTQLEKAQGGVIDGSSQMRTGTVKGGTTSIRDGMSN